MKKRVVITGMGAITPVGNSVSIFGKNLVNGVSGLNFVTGFDDVDLPKTVVDNARHQLVFTLGARF